MMPTDDDPTHDVEDMARHHDGGFSNRTTSRDDRRGDEEQHPPPQGSDVDPSNMISSTVAVLRLVCRLLKWPLTFVGLNVVVIVAVVNGFAYDDSMEEQVALYSLSMGCLLLGVLMLMDAIALYYAANQLLVQETTLLLQNEEDHYHPLLSTITTTEQLHLNAKVSRILDSFFEASPTTTTTGSSSATPKVSFLVNFVFALCGIALSAGGVLLFLSLQLTVISHVEYCFRTQQEVSDDVNNNNSNQNHNTVIPSDLRNWVYRRRIFLDFTPTNYVHLSNGLTFFVGREEGRDDEFATLYAQSSHDGKLEKVLDISQEAGHLFPIMSVEETEGFCFQYHDNTAQYSNFQGLLEPQSIFCYYQDQSHRLTWKLPQQQQPEDKNREPLKYWDRYHVEFARSTVLQDSPTGASSSSIWLRLAFYNYETQQNQVFVAKLDLPLMQIKNILSFQGGPGRPSYLWNDNCQRVNLLMTMAMGLLLTTFVSYWMTQKIKVPETHPISSGLVPVTFITIWLMAMNGGDEMKYFLSCALPLVGICIVIGFMLGPPFFQYVKNHRETILWAMYASFIALPMEDCILDECYMLDMGDPLVLLVVGALFIGLCLNHPVAQIVGGIGILASLLILVVGLVDGNVEVLLSVPLTTLASFGLISLGYQRSKYRSCGIYYGKLLLRYILRVVHAYTGRMIQETT